MEIWDIIEMAMREGEVEYAGKFFSIPRSPIAIRPVKRACPELYVTGLEPAVVQRTARSGHTPFITAGWKGFPLALDMRNHIARQYASVGLPDKGFPLAIQQYIFVTDDRTEALEMGERARAVGRIVTQMRTGNPVLDGAFIQAPPMPDEPPIETFRDNLVIGDAHLCAEKLVSEIRALGTTHLSLFTQIGSVSGAKSRRSLERFVRNVVPLIEAELGPLGAINAA